MYFLDILYTDLTKWFHSVVDIFHTVHPIVFFFSGPYRWHLHWFVYRKPSGSHALLLGLGLSDMAAQLQAPSCPDGTPCGGTTSGLHRCRVVPSNHGPLLWQVNWGCRERPWGRSVYFWSELYCIFRDGETHMDMTCSWGSGVLTFDMSGAPLGEGTCPFMPCWSWSKMEIEIVTFLSGDCLPHPTPPTPFGHFQ